MQIRFGNLLLLLALWCASAAAHGATNAPFRVLTYNIHHAEGLDGRVDVPRIAAVITNSGADLVALQEVDRRLPRTQLLDLPAELARLTGLTCVFSNNYAFQGGEYGNAILSRFPIVSATNTHYRMLGPGEPRGLLRSVVRVGGREIVFAVTHLDHRTNDAERLSNVADLHSLVAEASGRPVLLCGDFNDTPESRLHARLKERFLEAWEITGQGPGFTIPSEKPRKRIDFQWVNQGAPLVPRKAWVIATEASDHLPLAVEWQWR
jgi:endonuclease/exonuclease/phosphatase family metal-dependent hydrolase